MKVIHSLVFLAIGVLGLVVCVGGIVNAQRETKPHHVSIKQLGEIQSGQRWLAVHGQLAVENQFQQVGKTDGATETREIWVPLVDESHQASIKVRVLVCFTFSQDVDLKRWKRLHQERPKAENLVGMLREKAIAMNYQHMFPKLKLENDLYLIDAGRKPSVSIGLYIGAIVFSILVLGNLFHLYRSIRRRGPH